MANDRSLPASYDSALDDPFIKEIMFVEIQFDTGTVRMHDSVGSYTWSSQTWEGVGDLGAIEDIEETEEMGAYPAKLVLSGIPSSLFDEFVTTPDFFRTPVIIYYGMQNAVTGALLADPIEMKRGVCDVADVLTGNELTISVVIEDEDADLSTANGELYSNEQLQSDYTGDTFLQYVQVMDAARVTFPFGTELRFGTGGGSFTLPDFAKNFNIELF